jgi:hypothetical protein
MDNKEMKVLFNYISKLKKEFGLNSNYGNRRYTTFYIISTIDRVAEELMQTNIKGDKDGKK